MTRSAGYARMITAQGIAGKLVIEHDVGPQRRPCSRRMTLHAIDAECAVPLYAGAVLALLRGTDCAVHEQDGEYLYCAIAHSELRLLIVRSCDRRNMPCRAA